MMTSFLLDTSQGFAALSAPGAAVAVITTLLCTGLFFRALMPASSSSSSSSSSRQPSMPGPMGLPVIGSALSFAGGDMAAVVRKWTERYGKTFKFSLFGHPFVVISDPKDVRHVLMSKAFNSRWRSTNDALDKMAMKDLGVVLNNDLETWRLHRRMFSSALSGSGFVAHAVAVASERADVLLKRHLLPEEGASERITNVSMCFKFFSLDVIGTLAMGQKFGSLEEGEDHKLVRPVADFFEAWNHFVMLPPIMWKILSGKTNKYLKSIAYFQDFEMRTLDRAREAMSASKTDSEEAVDFPTLLLKEKKKELELGGSKVDASALSDEMMCQDIREMILAATDTTSNLLAFTFYLLAKYPDMARKVREEIERTVPEDTSDPEFLNSLYKLPYADAFVKEAGRVFPVIPILQRGATEDGVVGNHLIPKGTDIAVHQASVFMDPDVAKDPESFTPDRWLDKVQSSRLSKAVFPFGYGGRSCPGQHVAWLEIRAALARILPEVDIMLSEPGQLLETEFDITSRPKNNVLMLKFSPR